MYCRFGDEKVLREKCRNVPRRNWGETVLLQFDAEFWRTCKFRKSVSSIFGSYSRTFLMFANTNFESLYVGLVISLSK